MSLRKINYIIAQKWFNECVELMELYKADNSLTMDMEWALFQNYKNLNSVIQKYNLQLKQLEEKFGTLQEDGTRKLDTSSNVTMDMFNKEVSDLQQCQFNIKIESIDHKSIIGLKGVSLNVMMLLDFMIE